jgi:hypothetical protein
MHERLGLNIHRDAWPTPIVLAAHAAAGFGWVQVHTPSRAMLADRRHGLRHARALREALTDSGLRLVLHAPDDLSAGSAEHDRAFEGLIDYAAEACAELVAYHGLLGHLHITADATRSDHAAVLRACLPDVVLFHVHDNLGARRRHLDVPGADPLKMDLHLPPGRGSLRGTGSAASWSRTRRRSCWRSSHRSARRSPSWRWGRAGRCAQSAPPQRRPERGGRNAAWCVVWSVCRRRGRRAGHDRGAMAPGPHRVS